MTKFKLHKDLIALLEALDLFAYSFNFPGQILPQYFYPGLYQAQP